MKHICILGSTGSIGTSTLSIIERYPERFAVASLAAGRNLDLAFAQCQRWRPLLVSLATLVIAVVALVSMKEHFGGFQLVSNDTYTGTTLGIRWYLGVDGISIFLVLLSAVLFPLVLITGQNKPKPRAFAAWIRPMASHGSMR